MRVLAQSVGGSSAFNIKHGYLKQFICEKAVQAEHMKSTHPAVTQHP